MRDENKLPVFGQCLLLRCSSDEPSYFIKRKKSYFNQRKETNRDDKILNIQSHGTSPHFLHQTHFLITLHLLTKLDTTLTTFLRKNFLREKWFSYWLSNGLVIVIYYGFEYIYIDKIIYICIHKNIYIYMKECLPWGPWGCQPVSSGNSTSSLIGLLLKWRTANGLIDIYTFTRLTKNDLTQVLQGKHKYDIILSPWIVHQIKNRCNILIYEGMSVLGSSMRGREGIWGLR